MVIKISVIYSLLHSPPTCVCVPTQRKQQLYEINLFIFPAVEFVNFNNNEPQTIYILILDKRARVSFNLKKIVTTNKQSEDTTGCTTNCVIR